MRLATLILGFLLALAGTAHATTFEVADGASGDCSVGDPCGAIGNAVNAARSDSSGPHTIEVGPGTYEELLALDTVDDTDLTIRGSGAGDEPATDTVIQATLTAGIAQGIYIGTAGVTLENFHLDVTPVDIGVGETRGQGILVGGDFATIRDAEVVMGPTVAASADIGININAGTGALVDGTVVTTSGESTGVYSQASGASTGPDLVIRDSDVFGPSRGVSINASGSTAVIERTAIGADPDAEDSLEINANATVSSSLITGGVFAVNVFGNVSLRGVTVDRGEAGIADPKSPTSEGPLGAAVAAQSGTHVFDSSVAVEQVEAFGVLTCTNSNFTATAESGAGCPSGPSRPQGNFASPLSALFADAPGGDYDLPASSPAREGGRTGLGPGESATDFLGRVRVSGARHDQGAFEFQAAAVTPPKAPRVDTSTPDRTSPRLGGARFSPATFAVSSASTPKSARVKRGTTLWVRLSEPATVRIEIQKAAKGRRVKGKCRKPTAKRRKAKRCTRYVKVKGAVLTRRNQAAGLRKIKFSGRIGRKALKPGGYRALITATDAAGNRSTAVTPRFRIVRLKRR